MLLLCSLLLYLFVFSVIYPGGIPPAYAAWLAARPAAPALADPYLGQSIGPVPGYGVSQQQAHHTEQKQIEFCTISFPCRLNEGCN